VVRVADLQGVQTPGICDDIVPGSQNVSVQIVPQPTIKSVINAPSTAGEGVITGRSVVDGHEEVLRGKTISRGIGMMSGGAVLPETNRQRTGIEDSKLAGAIERK
jgi:hypothetical protein